MSKLETVVKAVNESDLHSSTKTLLTLFAGNVAARNTDVATRMLNDAAHLWALAAAMDIAKLEDMSTTVGRLQPIYAEFVSTALGETALGETAVTP